MKLSKTYKIVWSLLLEYKICLSLAVFAHLDHAKHLSLVRVMTSDLSLAVPLDTSPFLPVLLVFPADMTLCYVMTLYANYLL